MSAATPSDDDAVRAKAYELWLGGGMEHGRDKDDWTRAKEILSASIQTDTGADQAPSVAQAMVQGVLGMASSAMSAAANAVSGMLAAAPTAAPAKKPEPAMPTGGQAIPEAALEAAEKKLQVEAEAQIQGAKTQAAGSTASDASTSRGRVNSDG